MASRLRKHRARRAGARPSSTDVRTCFVIMPFRTKDDPARKDTVDFDAVFANIIAPAVASLTEIDGVTLECIRADKPQFAGWIHERMIQWIADADVAVVDITTMNPNVFYELGIRHALRDRVTVLIRRRGTANPFNIGGMMTIEYDEKKPEPAKQALRHFIRNGLLSAAKDSLVYNVLPGLTASRAPSPLPAATVEEYWIPGVRGRTLGIVAGNLRDANLNAVLEHRPIDVWVSSENVNMQMSRPYEGNISGLIRYLGAIKDETGSIVDDRIATELARKMKGRQAVNPGNVLATDPGDLAATHKVKRIYHAAAVYGVVGTGFHPIASVEQCVTNALALMDRESRTARGVAAGRESILFPVFGSGTARADLIVLARTQAQAALSYLRSRERMTRVRRVYFMALTRTHLSALRVAFAELGIVKRRRTVVGASSVSGRSRRKARAKR